MARRRFPAIALAMTNFFIGRRTDIDDLDVECQGYSSQGMIGANIYIEFTNFDNDPISWSVCGIHFDYHPRTVSFRSSQQVFNEDPLLDIG